MHDFDEGIIHIQKFLRQKPIIIVGTGLSLSMGLPGMGELLTCLKSKLPISCTTDELEEWEKCLDLIEKYGFEEGLGKITIRESLLMKIVDETVCLVGQRDEEFSKKLHEMQIEDFPFAKLLKHMVQSLPPQNPNLHIITPNYDHLIEYACDLIDVNCNTGFQGSQFQKFTPDRLKDDVYRMKITSEKGKQKREPRKIPSVKLLKPHGSLNWRKINENTYYQTHRDIADSTNVVITPGDTKYKSSLTDTLMNYHREMGNQCILSAEAVLVIGYGFNDVHLQTVLCDKLKSGVDCLILTMSLSDAAKTILKQHTHVMALEMEGQSGTKWYFDNEEGIWDEPLWDLRHFVKKII